MTHRLAVILLNYRTPDLVIDCLHSLVGQLNEQDIVVVVDNHSADDSCERIASAIDMNHWQNIRLIAAEHNGGFAAGNNLGCSAVDANFYLLINSDTIARSGAIEALVNAATNEPRQG